MPPWIKQWIYSLKFYSALAWEIRWFPSPFAPENVASKIHTSFDSLPNGSLGYLIHWSLTKTIALVLSFLNMSSLWRIPKITLKYIRSIWNLIFPKNIISYFLCEVVSAHFIDESREWALKTTCIGFSSSWGQVFLFEMDISLLHLHLLLFLLELS